MSKVLVDRELLARLHGVITDEQRLRVTDVGLVYELLAQPIVSGLVPDGYALVSLDSISQFPEINPANYGDDEVIALNNWAIDLLLAASPSHLSFEQLKATKRARVNAFLHERQNELLVNMLAGIPSAKGGDV
jgi:hypothetical protein